MGNIFKSDEVYKHLKYDLHDRNEIVAVRGVYVTGVYSPPYYSDPILMINQVSSNPATIADFIETDQEGTDAYMRITSFGVVIEPLTVTNYITTRDNQYDAYMRIINFGLNLGNPTIKLYETTKKDCEDSFMRIIGFECATPTIVPTLYSVDKGSSAPEPILRISGISSTAAIIDNTT